VNRRSLLRGAALGALCALLVAAVSRLDSTFLGAEWLLGDSFTRILARRRPPDHRIVIVAVSDESTRLLDAAGFGRWPYSREVWASAIRELRHAGARTIAVDLTLSDANASDPAGDRALAAALDGAPVVLGVQTTAKAGSAGPFAGKLWRITPQPKTTWGVIPPNEAFRAAAGIGTLRIVPSERSGAVHDYPIADAAGNSKGGAFVPSLALEAARMYEGAPRQGRFTSDAFLFGKHVIPSREGRFAIQWHSAGKKSGLQYDVIGLEHLVAFEAGALPEKRAWFESQLRGRIVLIAATAAGTFDLRSTPLSPIAAGVEIHANALDDILNDRFHRDAALPLQLALLIASAALFGALVNATRAQWASGLLAILFLILWLGIGFGALASGLVVRTVAGLTSIALTFVVITVVKFVEEQQQTVLLRTTFGRYVSPQILEHILAHPEKVHLGGERRDLTILFSDIRGFTSISEASEPEQVVEMLNEYLTKMVEILLAHGGTLDKFIGDAVMGFWNAPAADPDHARHAVRCAIAMIEETARLRERWEREGKAAIRIGIGINTGDAVAGNIGAEQVWSYTVIGDAVNLASRLESKNKDYSTEIIISELTLARIGDEFETVYLDDVKVKGKEKAVKIYEVRGLK
jgi:adenylate cyclase